MTEWYIEDVKQWATTILQNAKIPREAIDSTVEILMGEDITGPLLLGMGSCEELKSCGLIGGTATCLWAEIEKMKKNARAALTTTRPKGKT